MITEIETQWIAEYCPTLNINQEFSEVSGLLEFRAIYNASDGFTWLLDQKQSSSGEILTNTYEIVITKPENSEELPLLKIEDDDSLVTINRHFNLNGTACLCGPVEKRNFISSGFSFVKYLERLVIPFLYEQTYYDKYGKWPWGEYGHGAIGIFQSLINSEEAKEDIEVCLKDLRKDKYWNRIRAILSGRERVTESSKCFCSSQEQIRSCHPWILFAIMKLRNSIRNKNVIIG